MGENFDFVIVGAGIIGLATARALRAKLPDAKILVLDKEEDLGAHASGRNSGVLHAGFYYSADSLKARFCVEGNNAMKEFCKEHSLPLLECGKLVVAKNSGEVAGLEELHRRGVKNGVGLELIDADSAQEIDPNARTTEKALWSPNTASASPKAVIQKLAEVLKNQNVEIRLGERFLAFKRSSVTTSEARYGCGFLINAAGLYADKIAHPLGVGRSYTLLPFKGLYLKYKGPTPPVRTHIYPVPDLKLPFLGVHFTLTCDGIVKIGPTATPAFWREQYSFSERFSLLELAEVLSWEARLFLTNSFHFRDLAFQEIQKYSKRHFVALSKELVKSIDVKHFSEWAPPGIRAQLLDKRSGKLVQDFVIESGEQSLHVLNAISPAWTCSFPIGDHVAALALEQNVRKTTDSHSSPTQ